MTNEQAIKIAQKKLKLNKEEALINAAGMTYFMRDVLERYTKEDNVFIQNMKKATNQYIKVLNIELTRIADNPEVWQELEQLVNHFHDNMIK